MITLSLRLRLSLLVALLFAVFALFFLTLYTSRMQAQALRAAEGRSLGIARVLAVSESAAVDFADPVNAAAHLGQLSSTPDATFAEVHGQDGALLAEWHGERRMVAFAAVPEGLSISEGHHLLVRVPVPTRSGAPGTLVVSFNLEELWKENGRNLRFALLVSSLIIALGVVAAYLLGTLLVRPLRRMTQVAERIAQGDPGAQAALDTTSLDEAGALARVLDVMLSKLGEARAQAEAQSARVTALNLELEARVEERTRALASANAELGDRLGELKRAQEQLIISDRHNAVGLLAAGVAHEINNPIAYVSANVRFVSQSLRERGLAGPEEEEWAQALDEAGSGCDRVAYIVKSLKTFSRTDEARPAPVQVERAVEVAINMATHEIKQRATLEKSFSPVPPVGGSEVRLAQVVLNLLVNAAQAIPAGSAATNTIRVTVGPSPRGEAMIVISDTGSGMTKEVRDRLFTPFFTTKPIGLGTGLGLSICHGIVSGLGGRIEVETAPGKGTTFTVFLPPSDAAPGEDAPLVTPPQGTARRSQILVIDDEPLVATALKRVLAPEHDVTLAASGQEGLARAAKGRWDLVLCDLMMPDMTGVQFAAAIAETLPALSERLYFISGGAFTAETRAFYEQRHDRFISKPIDFAALRALARELGRRPRHKGAA